MAIGDWVIGSFVPSNVIKDDYGKEEITLTCGSFKKDNGDDPLLEIMEIEELVVEGFSNNVSFQGNILQTFPENKVYTITDGHETWYGAVVDVQSSIDSYGNDFIQYQIKLAVVEEVGDAFNVMELPDGDEVTFDDDWEAGFETYDPCGNTRIERIGVASYNAGKFYDNIKVYANTNIFYNPNTGQYVMDNNYYRDSNGIVMGYGQDTMLPSRSQNVNKVVINFQQAVYSVTLIFVIKNQGTVSYGKYGQVIVGPTPNDLKEKAILTVNGQEFEISSVNGMYQTINVNLGGSYTMIYSVSGKFGNNAGELLSAYIQSIAIKT
jgi:hypothetical protein